MHHILSRPDIGPLLRPVKARHSPQLKDLFANTLIDFDLRHRTWQRLQVA